jgi:MerR family transcriptional regulator/heat shock protein HspR
MSGFYISHMENRPLYTIGITSDLLDVHSETLRVWERHGLLQPHRKHGQRLYTNNDLKRLSFIKELVTRGLNLAGISEYLSFYPCWLRDDCPSCMRRSNSETCGKRCWKEKGTYCRISLEETDVCDTCEYRKSKRGLQAAGVRV